MHRPSAQGPFPNAACPAQARVSPRALGRLLEVVALFCASEGPGASSCEAEVCGNCGCVLAGDPSNPPQPAVTSAPLPRPDQTKAQGGWWAESQRVACRRPLQHPPSPSPVRANGRGRGCGGGNSRALRTASSGDPEGAPFLLLPQLPHLEQTGAPKRRQTPPRVSEPPQVQTLPAPSPAGSFEPLQGGRPGRRLPGGGSWPPPFPLPRRPGCGPLRAAPVPLLLSWPRASSLLI